MLSIAFHAGNRGSNPLGDANKINGLALALSLFCVVGSKQEVDSFPRSVF
jgi:hypothetical protein